MPKNPYCASCMRAKMQAKPARSIKNRARDADYVAPTKFGEKVTADHLIARGEEDHGFNDSRAAIVIYDLGSKWIECHAAADKSADMTREAMNNFQGSTDVVQSFYSDSSPELNAAARQMGWVHPKATPGRPDNNGVAERAVRRVIGGARTILEHAGLNPSWWPLATKHFCVTHNIEEVAGTSPFKVRFPNSSFDGEQLPFGCLIDFKPSPVKGKVAPKFAPKAMPGVSWVGKYNRGASFVGNTLLLRLQSLKLVSRILSLLNMGSRYQFRG